MIRWLWGGVVLFLVGCMQGVKPPAYSTQDVYRFNERPYDAVKVSDRELYNYLFNIIRNKLIFYVIESSLHLLEPFGVVLELDISGEERSLGARREAPAVRGWFLFERDSVPVEEEFLFQYKVKSLPETYRDLAKATFWVEKQDSETYRVFVRYWNKTAIYEFLYHVKKQNNFYVIIRTQSL